MLEPLWQQSVNKTEGWPVKFSALLDKLQQSGFCALKPDETNLFNQQEFLSNSNPGTSTQDLVGSVTRVVGYAVVHDQDRDRDVHKPSAALGKRPASALSKGSPRKPVPYLLQTVSARLESSPCILSDKPAVKSRAKSPRVKSRAISLTPGRNLTPTLCWKNLSSLVGSEQPLTYVRMQMLQYATALAKKYMT